MFERFTDRARRVVILAQEEARMLNHNYIGTEHILLGLIHESEGVAAKSLESLGVSLEGVRSVVEEIIGRGVDAPAGHIPFTPRAKKILEMSHREALQLGHNYIGTEHILLGTLREGEGVAAQVLVKLGADLNRVRRQVIQLLSGYQGKEPAYSGSEPTDRAEVSAAERISRLTAMIAAIDQRSDILELIATAPSELDATAQLVTQFGFTENQAHAVLDMEMRLFTTVTRERLQREAQALKDHISERVGTQNAMITAIDRRGELVELVAGASTDQDAIERLIEEFGFTAPQAQAVLGMGINRFTASTRQALQREIQQLTENLRAEPE